MAKLIALKDCVAIVDDSDYEKVSKYSWWADYHKNGRIYARAKVNGKNVRLHRLILNAKPGDLVDHINGNESTLDCRKKNLRLATKRINALNSKVNSRNSSGYCGVTFHPETGKWRSSIVVNGKRKSLGLYFTKIEASNAYELEHTNQMKI